MQYIIGGIVGAIIMWLIMHGRRGKAQVVVSEAAHQLRQEHLDAVMAMFTSKPELTNNDIQSALNISDATATRYFDELERQGKVEQIGRAGAFVTYRPKP